MIAEWKTVEGNNQVLQHTPGLFSCPPRIQIIVDTIHSAVSAFRRNKGKWFPAAVRSLKQTDSFKDFKRKRDKALPFADLLKKWQKRTKQRYFIDAVRAGAKLNRFGHAMDPDRGIIIFISCLISNSHKIYGEYALMRPRHPELKKPYDDLNSMLERLKGALDFDKVPEWLKELILKHGGDITEVNRTIDFHSAWVANFDQLSGAVPGTLAYFTDGIYLGHDGPLLIWHRDKLLGGNVKKDFHDLLKKEFGFDQKSQPTPVAKVSTIVDEDEVTYALAHRVLIPNKFRIISISYPGAQGGSAVLPDPTEGKRQKREYPDIVALPPMKARTAFDALLSENKGMFKQGEVESDVGKLQRYQSSDKHRSALRDSLVKARVMDSNHKLRDILIGVGFGVASPTPTTWRLDEVDFVFRIVERKRWAIGIFNQELKDLIPRIEGNTDFPKCYAIVTTKPVAKKPKQSKADSALNLFNEDPDNDC